MKRWQHRSTLRSNLSTKAMLKSQLVWNNTQLWLRICSYHLSLTQACQHQIKNQRCQISTNFTSIFLIRAIKDMCANMTFSSWWSITGRILIVLKILKKLKSIILRKNQSITSTNYSFMHFLMIPSLYLMDWPFLNENRLKMRSRKIERTFGAPWNIMIFVMPWI